MITNPILPIWLISIFCVILLLLKRKGIIPYIRQIIMVLLIFVINLRIMIPKGEVPSQIQSLDLHVLFVVDNTISMIAYDYNGDTKPRLTAVKADCEYIIDELYGASFSVISFHNECELLAPFTNDGQFIKNVINAIYPLDPLWAKGTSMNICKEQMKRSLKSANKDENGRVIVFFISDGEITNDDKLASFHEFDDMIDNGAVLGYGTAEGGKMFIKDRYSGEYTTVYDVSDYSDAISKIDESNLKQLASDMDINYVNMNNRDNINDVLQSIKKEANVSTEDKSARGYDETYYYFAITLALLLVFEFVNQKRRL